MARRRRAIEATADAGDDLARLADDALSLLREASLAPSRLRAVGVAAPGPLDRERGVLLDPPNLPWRGETALCARLVRALGAPVFLENDANAGALAEWRYGAGRGCRDLVFLTMSTGVGAGLILGGRLYRGRGGLAGELGHAPVVFEGERCVCGLRGCLEAYVGGAAWTRRLRRTAPRDGALARCAGGRERIAPEHVVAAAREGDPFACAELDRFNDHLARAITWLAMSLAPELVVLGTIAAGAGEALCLAPVRERVAAQTWMIVGQGLRIEAAALGAELADYAGVCVAWEAGG